MKFFWTYFSLLILFVIQTTICRYIRILGVMPNLVFVFAVCYSMHNYPVRSAVLCAVAGLLMDCFGSAPIGLNTLLYLYIGLAISNFGSSLMNRSLITAAIGTIIATVICQSANLIFSYVISGYSSFWLPFATIIIPEAFYNCIFAIVVSAWTRWLGEEKIRGF